jgi:hypothetical protein
MQFNSRYIVETRDRVMRSWWQKREIFQIWKWRNWICQEEWRVGASHGNRIPKKNEFLEDLLPVIRHLYLERKNEIRKVFIFHSELLPLVSYKLDKRKEKKIIIIQKNKRWERGWYWNRFFSVMTFACINSKRASFWLVINTRKTESKKRWMYLLQKRRRQSTQYQQYGAWIKKKLDCRYSWRHRKI